MIGNRMDRRLVARWRYGGTCAVCEKATDWTCTECKMYVGTHVWLCPDKACRESHQSTCCVAVAAN